MPLITVRRWRRNTNDRSPQPPKTLIDDMLGELEADLALRNARPTAVACGSFRVAGEIASFIAIEAQMSDHRGEKLSRWWQWQHPVWRFVDPPPALEHLRAAPPPVLSIAAQSEGAP